jgi:hypothetical protein
VVVTGRDGRGLTIAAIRSVKLRVERKRGRGYHAGHQSDLQALSHYRAIILIATTKKRHDKTAAKIFARRHTSPSRLPPGNLTENLQPE